MKQEYHSLKKFFLGFSLGFLPVAILIGLLSLLEIVPVNFNGKPYYGILGLIISVCMFAFISIVFSLMCFLILNTGIVIYNNLLLGKKN